MRNDGSEVTNQSDLVQSVLHGIDHSDAQAGLATVDLPEAGLGIDDAAEDEINEIPIGSPAVVTAGRVRIAQERFEAGVEVRVEVHDDKISLFGANFNSFHCSSPFPCTCGRAPEPNATA